MGRLDHLSAHSEGARTVGSAALDARTAEPAVDAARVAAIGYCYGATTGLELARQGAPLRAVVGYHPGLRTIRVRDAADITGVCGCSWAPTTRSSRRNTASSSSGR